MPTLLQQAINAIKVGDKETAKPILASILRANPNDEIAWLWTSVVVESETQQRYCLQKVLTINPNNEVAQRGLSCLVQTIPETGISPTVSIESKPNAGLSPASTLDNYQAENVAVDNPPSTVVTSFGWEHFKPRQLTEETRRDVSPSLPLNQTLELQEGTSQVRQNESIEKGSSQLETFLALTIIGGLIVLVLSKQLACVGLWVVLLIMFFLSPSKESKPTSTAYSVQSRPSYQSVQPQGEVRCPKCNSTQIAANQKGFGVGKATTGAVLLGPLGLLGGFVGSSKVKVTCLRCGHQWEPGKD